MYNRNAVVDRTQFNETMLHHPGQIRPMLTFISLDFTENSTVTSLYGISLSMVPHYFPNATATSVQSVGLK